MTTGVDRNALAGWVARYEQVWRSGGTDRLGELFTDDASYSPAPWNEPMRGLAAIAEFWAGDGDSALDEFSMTAEIVALDGAIGVVRVAVDYPAGDPWRDLWVITLTDDGRCSAFEEWPFAPQQRTGHE